MGEIGGAVERIHIPAVIGTGLLAAALFAHDVVLGETAAQPLDDQRFRAAVRFGDDVRGALVVDLVRTIRELREQRAGFARDFDRRAEVILSISNQ